MKKIISLLSAFAMIASMAVSVSAAEAPEIKLVLNFAETGETLGENYDEEYYYYEYHGAPVYKVELSIEGVSKRTPVKDGSTIVGFTGCTVNSVQTVFAYEAEKDVVCIAYKGWPAATSNYATAGELTYAFTTADNYLKTDKDVIGTWYFVAKDMSAIENMKIGYKSGEKLVVKIDEYWDGSSKDVTLSQIAVTPTVVPYPAAPAGEAMKDGVLVASGLHAGKTSATTSVYAGASVTSIKVKDSDGKEQTASLPTLLGQGYANIMTVILYNANEMAGKTFNVEYFAGEEVVKTYTYKVPSSN